jgi:DNA primase
MQRFDALVRPQRDARSLFPRRQWSKKAGRFVPPEPPASAAARTIGAQGIDRQTGRAILSGLAAYPEAIAGHVEALATLPFKEKDASRLRDLMIDAAMSGQTLDRDRLATILRDAGASPLLEEVRRGGGMSFTFNRPDSDPSRAVRDLGIAIETLSAQREIAAALADATERLKQGDESAFDEQLRLHAAQGETTERLAKLTASD